MKLCRHQPHCVIDWIKEPKYSTDEVLISVDAVSKDIEHYIIKFSECNSYKEWFYMGGRVIRQSRVQPNGRGQVYVVSMSKRESFEPITKCEHDL